MSAALGVTSRRAEWLERIVQVSVLDVASSLGLDVAGPRGSSGGSIYNCPACGSERRHRTTRDKRGAIGVRQDQSGWRCFQCDASGDSLGLISYSLAGRRFADLPDESKADVREWCMRFLGISSAHSHQPIHISSPPPPRPVSVDAGPKYPPIDEVRSLLKSTRCVSTEPTAISHLGGKHRPGIHVERLPDLGLARILPRGALGLPAWAAWWPDAGLRVILPACNPNGELVTVRARSVDTKQERPPKDFNAGKTAMMCPLARSMARGDADAGQHVQAVGIVITEGVPAFLAWATRWPDSADDARAVIGIYSGSWTQELADRIPDGTRVTIDTDPDGAGAKYLAVIEASLVPRWRVGRLRLDYSERTASMKESS